jgi:hypothetical protein
MHFLSANVLRRRVGRELLVACGGWSREVRDECKYEKPKRKRCSGSNEHLNKSAVAIVRVTFEVFGQSTLPNTASPLITGRRRGCSLQISQERFATTSSVPRSRIKCPATMGRKPR